MPKPHGNKLINRYETRSSTELEEIPTYQINTNLAEDVINIATGVFSPLTGFLTENDLDGVVNEKRLDSDVPWTIPILFDYDASDKIKEDDTILLTNDETGLKALLDVKDIYAYNKKTIAQEVYGTTDSAHPGVNMLYTMKDHFIGMNTTLHPEKHGSSSKREAGERSLHSKQETHHT